MDTITATGRYGSVSFDGTFVTITRTGVGRYLTGSGEKRIHVKNIAAINFKAATALFQGRIEFTVPGGQERRAGPARRSKKTGTDENALLFYKKSNEQFAVLKDAVYAAQAELL
ncbi:DUF4429 domain-containing protein [Amycolatopsis halotolerans]|uniref:DUF4429 domain-containing protein n=1 Tax=Amycolatopsis halotolerans TaxID=330083 RepID=A0ABV7QE49_9PSEU